MAIRIGNHVGNWKVISEKFSERKKASIPKPQVKSRNFFPLKNFALYSAVSCEEACSRLRLGGKIMFS